MMEGIVHNVASCNFHLDHCQHCQNARLANQRTIQSLQADNAALREGLERIVEGDVPRPVGESWWPDKRTSKQDKCIHGVWMYEDCGECISDFARALIGEQS